MLNHDRVEIDWITVSSYGDSTTSSGVIRMLREPDLKVEVPIRYVGFDIAPDFVAGYGMDYAQRYRNLPYIAVLEY